LPSVGIAVARFLAEQGPRTAEEIRLVCDPIGLNDSKESKVLQTVTRWVQLGVFKAEEGRVSLSEEATRRDLFPKNDPLFETFRWFVLQRVLKSAVFPVEDSPAGDFLIATWWLTQVAPKDVRLDSDVAAIQAAAARFPDRTVIQNNTRWQGLLDWSQFLGFGTVLNGCLIPNPLPAVRWALAEPDFPEEMPLPAVDFMRSLTATLPIFGDGVAARAAADFLRPGGDSEGLGHDVSPSLSLALLSLESQGTLRLEGREDSQSIILLRRLDGEQRRVETITIHRN
jgi:hypothetical protein